MWAVEQGTTDGILASSVQEVTKFTDLCGEQTGMGIVACPGWQKASWGLSFLEPQGRAQNVWGKYQSVLVRMLNGALYLM